jgi:flagellar basal-body rod protein FlgG
MYPYKKGNGYRVRHFQHFKGARKLRTKRWGFMRGLYNAAGSMLVNQVRLENISNNLANINTPGYKRSEVVAVTFPEILLYRTEKMAGSRKAVASPVGLAAENIAVEETYLVNISGSLSTTGRELDLALQGPGFFAVETPQGMRYTRDGHLQVNADGILVNFQGFPVLGDSGRITLRGEHPVIDGSGNIYEEGVWVDRLQILGFVPENSLWKDEYNLLQAAEGAIPLRSEDTEVLQGCLEESNVDLMRQMTDLVKARRSYEAAQKIFQTYDRLLSRTANELGSLG